MHNTCDHTVTSVDRGGTNSVIVCSIKLNNLLDSNTVLLVLNKSFK